MLFKPIALRSYFMIVNGTEGASLCLSGVEIEFVNPMSSMVFILGGKVIFKNVKINNQLNWESELVYSHSSTSSVTVELHSCTITNSNYSKYNNRTSIIHFSDLTTATQSITLNISFCLCLNNSFNYFSDYGGGFGLFYSNNASSGMFFFIKKDDQ
jgi:hypothetical protein